MDFDSSRPSSSDLAALLAEPALATSLAEGGAIFLAATSPARLVYASGSLQTFFGVTRLDSLAIRLLEGGQAKPGLASLFGQLAPGAPGRLERVRFAFGLRVETVTVLLRRTQAPVSVIIGMVVGARINQPKGGFPPALSAATPNPQAAPVAMAPAPAAPPVVAMPSAPEPVAVVAPAPNPTPAPSGEVAALTAALAARHAHAPFIRFLWQTDAAGRLTSLTGPFCDVLGCSTGVLIGLDFAELARACGSDAQDALRKALGGRETWSGLELLWPIAKARAAAPITLGGLPALDAERRFHGYRGYGVIHINRLEPSTGDWTPPAPVVIPSLAPVAASEPARDPEPTPFARLTNVVSIRERRPEAPVIPETPAAPPDAPQAPVPEPREPARGREASNLVELSSTERTAFREIARALGARVDDDAPARRESSEDRAQRIRDLIDLATVRAVTPASESRPRSLRLAQDPPRAVPEPPRRVAPQPVAPASVLDGVAANAAGLLDRLPVGVLVSRMEIPVFLNRTLLDLLGFVDADAFHAAGGLDAIFTERARDREPPGSASIRDADGQLIPVDIRIQAIEWDGVPATLTTFRRPEADLNPRLRALEGDLRERELETRELRTILDTATDGVAVLDGQGVILSLNRSAEALFGYEQADVAGEPFTSLLARESHPAALDYLEGLKSNGVASVMNDGREFMGRARQGGSIPLYMTLGRIASTGEQKFCAVLRDLTPWKKVEREIEAARKDAEHASALKSDFLAKVSHEIRTPLNAIMGFAEVIMEERFGPVGNERYKDYLKDIHASGAHVMSLVNDLLDLSKIEAGKLELTFGSVDANRVVSECISLMQPQANRDRVIIRSSLAQRLPNIVADERSLRQIVLNLLSNAVKFNEAGGQVIVSTALTDAGHAVIRIRDTGIGMSDSELQVAMEPFRQIATARRAGGTGLGLPLTKALVEANRASFTIKSKQNDGTLIEVAFPPTRVLAE